MIKIFQITSFYSIVGLIITGLLGFYPRIDPTFFAKDIHMKIGTYTIYALFFVQAFGFFLFLKKKKEIKSSFYNTKLGIEQLKTSLKVFNKIFFVWGLNFIFIITPLVTGILLKKGSFAKGAHFHTNATCLLILIAFFFYIAYQLDLTERKITEYKKLSGINYIEPVFIDDDNKKGFDLALKFLFLGINVWTPYLILKYAVGLSMLKGFYFLPIHLAGVLPFSFLKRKYKFARLINPNYKGKIKKREKYNMAEVEA